MTKSLASLSRKHFSHVRSRLLLLLFCALTPALGAILGISLHERQVMVSYIQSGALRLLYVWAEVEEQLVSQVRQQLIVLSQVPEIQTLDVDACNAFLARVAKHQPQYLNLGISDLRGNIVCSAIPLTQSVNIADRPYFQRVLETRDFSIGEYQIGRITGLPALNFGYPVIDESGTTRAVVFASLNLASFYSEAENVQLDSEAVVIIIDSNGTILARYPDPQEWAGKQLTNIPIIFDEMSRQGAETVEARGLDGGESLYVYMTVENIPENSLYVIVSIPKAIAFAAAYEIFTKYLLVFGITAISAAAILWVSTDRLILRSLKALLGTIARFGANDFNVRVWDVKGPEEIQQLAATFNEMAGAIQRYDLERQQAEQELKALYEATSVLFQSNNLIDLGKQITQAVVRNFQHADCGLVLVDPGQKTLIRFARSGSYGMEAENPLEVTGPGLVPEAIRLDKTIYAPNVASEPRYLRSDPRTQSELVIPLRTSKGVLGALDLQSQYQDAFRDDDQRILSAYAERAAAAIEIMHLYEELNHHTRQLESLVEERTAELWRTKERVEAVLNNSGDAIILTSFDGIIQQMNSAFYDLFGYDPDDSFGQSLLKLAAPESLEPFLDRLAELVNTGHSKRIEIVAQHKDGTVFDAEIALGGINDGERVEGIVCNLRDVTERKQIEKALRESEARFRSFFELPLIGMTLTSVEKGITTINEKLCEMFGYSREEIFQKTWAEITHPDDLAMDVEQFDQVLAGTIDGYSLDKRFIRKDGQVIYTIMTCRCLRDNQGKVIHFVALVQDITERKQLEAELRELLEREKELNELKTRFISAVSHDFRTPLTVIQSSSGILQRYNDRLSDEQKLHHFNHIQTSITYLTQLLDGVLTISRADSGHLIFNPKPMDLLKTCNEIVEAIKVAHGKTHQLNFSVHSPCPEIVADEHLIRQILMNLLSNAVKYSPKGSQVCFDLMCDDRKVTLRIQDHGIGIPFEDQKQLFEPFHRARNVDNIAGTGLGLAIVKRAVEAHRGLISVESEVNLGTTFTICLPF